MDQPNKVWTQAHETIIRGGPHGLIGNWSRVDAARTVIRNFLQNEEDQDEEVFVTWEEEDAKFDDDEDDETGRFAGVQERAE